MSWQQKVSDFCNHYNIPINFLAETLNEPKVVPMIRGKAFEFSVFEKLLNTLNSDVWLIEKPMMNAQFGMHDEDVRVVHKETNISISIECKLSAKGRFRKQRDGHFTIPVKCMRSRTLGDARIAQLAPVIGVSEEVLKVHNDQYVLSDFDIVITSIGNAYYETNQETDMFEWAPTQDGIDFLKKMFNTEAESDLKDLAFNKMYVTSSENITIRTSNWHNCTRRSCVSKTNCGFIPNYPIINFPALNADGTFNPPNNGWVDIESSEEIFLEIVRQKSS